MRVSEVGKEGKRKGEGRGEINKVEGGRAMTEERARVGTWVCCAKEMT